MGFFAKYIFSLLSPDMQKRDNYVWADGRGFTQRYLSAFEDELDNGIMPFIDNFVDIFDLLKTQDKYLGYLGVMLGSPVNPDNQSATYRQILDYAVKIWRVKGSIKSFQLFFAALGLQVDIIENTPGKGTSYDLSYVMYDGGFFYDTDCEYCTNYWLTYNSINDTTSPFVHTAVDPALLTKCQAIVNQLTPINARFQGFIERVLIAENVNVSISESATYV